MTAIVLRGDARRLPLPDACVDLIVTSPPYFGLRSYTDTCRVCLDIRATGFDPAETIKGYDEHVRMRHHYDGQIGSEATPQEWVAALVECTREWARVLKPSGSMFVNLGDKYAAGHGGSSTEGNGVNLTVRRTRPAATHWGGEDAHPSHSTSVIVPGTKPKSLLGLPWRYAIAATDQLGLILRRDIIWAKPNGLPESVTDRCRSSHEYVFHLTRQPRYYAAVDEIREPHAYPAAGVSWEHRKASGEPMRQGEQRGVYPGGLYAGNPLGKLPGSVWNIPSQPLTVPPGLGVDHFAAFPSELPRRCVLGWSPGGVCVACGEGRRPVRETDWSSVPHRMERRAVRDNTPIAVAEFVTKFAAWCKASNVTRGMLDRTAGTASFATHWVNVGGNTKAIPNPDHWTKLRTAGLAPAELDCYIGGWQMVPVAVEDIGIGPEGSGRHRNTLRNRPGVHRVSGYACACPTPDAPTRPAIVLDPFGGTGTTALVASVYGRTGISIDHSADYNRIAAWRTQDPAERCRVIGAPKPPPVLDGQDALFDFTADGAAT